MNLCLRALSCFTFSSLAVACIGGGGGSTITPTSVCVAPAAADAPIPAGANELVTVTGEPGPPLVSLQIDGRALHLVDDGTAGDETVGDGVFTTAVRVAQPVQQRWCAAIAPASSSETPPSPVSVKLRSGTCRIVTCGTGGTEGDAGICLTCDGFGL